MILIESLNLIPVNNNNNKTDWLLIELFMKTSNLIPYGV